MKYLLIAMMLAFGAASVNAADDKAGASKKLSDADAKDLISVRVLEENVYVLKKNGDKLDVVLHNKEVPFLRIKQHDKVQPGLEKMVKDTLQAYHGQAEGQKTTQAKESPATLYEFHSDAARRLNDQWQNGAANAGQTVAPVVGVLGQLASLFL